MGEFLGFVKEGYVGLEVIFLFGSIMDVRDGFRWVGSRVGSFSFFGYIKG